MPDNKSELCSQEAHGFDLNLPPPPYNLEVEQAVLSAILVENNIANTVFKTLEDWCFYKAGHQFDWATKLIVSNAKILKNFLSKGNGKKSVVRLEKR